MIPTRIVRWTLLASTVAGGLFAVPAVAQPVADSTRREVRAVRVANGAIDLDGRLDEAVWRDAPPASGFVQREPTEGAPAAERSEVRIAYDDRALYLGARLFSDRPTAIQAPVGRRDNLEQMEHLLVSLDSYLDRRTAYTFGVAASGVRADWVHLADSETRIDRSFDPVWEAETRIDSLGWTVEMRIPFSQLRFTDRPEQTWGINLVRRVPTRNATDLWAPVPRDVQAWASRFGTLVGIAGVHPSRRLELLPYVASNATLRGEVAPGDPFHDQRELDVRVGGDLKVGLGPSLTLEATVNPDFGQVEADPAVVNLSQYEVFFSERRPFFVEGAGLLRGDGPSYFYSRRVGGLPGDGVPDLVVGAHDAAYVDAPYQSTILGAAKLTGRMGAGTSLGVLAAVNDEEFARLADAEAAPLGRVLVAPRTALAVTRLQRQFGAAQSTVGLSLTGARRFMAQRSTLDSLLTREALAGGVDWTLRFRGGEYEVGGWLGGSYVAGSEAALLRLQRNPTHYFQRPDAAYVSVDPERTSLAGWSGRLAVERQSGEHWLWSVEGLAHSPAFEINDAGRLPQADLVGGFARLRYRETRPRHGLRDYSVMLSSENVWDFGGVRSFGALRLDTEATLPNFWRASITSWVDFRSQSFRATRGGPYMGTAQAWVVSGALSSSPVARTRWSGNLFYGENELGERTVEAGGSFSVRPGPQWQLSLSPSVFSTTNPRQYIARRPNGPEATFGQRYIFSFVEREELRLSLRLNYALTPDLTLETYAEPYVSTGTFHDFGELRAARARDLRFYGTGGTSIERDGALFTVTDSTVLVEDEQGGAAEPFRFTFQRGDFRVLSFRSNAVLRWEWRPGSTLFVVWQQDRSGFAPVGGAVRAGDLWDALSARGDNVLAVKASFWLTPR